jgi:hypothetical protein
MLIACRELFTPDLPFLSTAFSVSLRTEGEGVGPGVSEQVEPEASQDGVAGFGVGVDHEPGETTGARFGRAARDEGAVAAASARFRDGGAAPEAAEAAPRGDLEASVRDGLPVEIGDVNGEMGRPRPRLRSRAGPVPPGDRRGAGALVPDGAVDGVGVSEDFGGIGSGLRGDPDGYSPL